MCGRYTLTTDYANLQNRFSFEEHHICLTQRYNIAPTQDVFTVWNDNAHNHAHMMRWGFIPYWSTNLGKTPRLINARAETLTTNKIFQYAFARQRCLVIADSFYEWKRTTVGGVPIRIMLKTGRPFALAGLWSKWKPKDNPNGQAIYSCAIVTTVSNSLIESIHERMPVILSQEAESAWLDPNFGDTAELRELLLPYSADKMTSYQVSSTVNSVRHENLACIQPV